MLSLMLMFMSPVALDSFDEMIQRDHSSESASAVPYGTIVCFCSVFFLQYFYKLKFGRIKN